MYQDVREHSAFISHLKELIERVGFKENYHAMIYAIRKLHLDRLEFIQIVSNVMRIPEFCYFLSASELWNSASTLLIHSIHLGHLYTGDVPYD